MRQRRPAVLLRTSAQRISARLLAVALMVLALAGAPAAQAGPGGSAPGKSAVEGTRPGMERYRIDARSADSWAHYYQRIGLGTVHQGPHSPEDWAVLTSHCEALEGITGQIWIPLGYSIQRGYRLCFRPGPFSRAEAKVFCARLLMEVRVQSERIILCEREQDGVRYEDVNPYLRGM